MKSGYSIPLEPYRIITKVVEEQQPYASEKTKQNLVKLLMLTQGQESNFGRDSDAGKANLYGITNGMMDDLAESSIEDTGKPYIYQSRGDQESAAKLALSGYLAQKRIKSHTIQSILGRMTSWAKNWNTKAGASKGNPQFVREEFRF